VTIRLFAGVRERIGSDVVSVNLQVSATVAELRSTLATAHPEASGLITRSAVAVNGEYAAADHRVSPADEIALIPPVSGG
jgi:molybdopterin converting factor subunit 1